MRSFFLWLTLSISLAVVWAADGAILTRMQPVTGTGIDYPKLVQYADASRMDRVNKRIDKLTRTFRCESSKPAPDGRPTYFDVSARVSCAAHEVLSIEAVANAYCGGTTPVKQDASITFDLSTGREVPFEALFADFDRDKAAILARVFARQMQRKRPAKGAACQWTENPYALENLVRSSFAYHVSEKSIAIQPVWKDDRASCAEEVGVPLASLAGFAARGGILARLAAAAPAPARPRPSKKRTSAPTAKPGASSRRRHALGTLK